MKASLLGRAGTIAVVFGSTLAFIGACSSANGGSKLGGSGASGGTGGTGGYGATGGFGNSGGFGNTGGTGFDGGGGSGGLVGDPKTCQQAADAKSYIGCDFWPTVVANNVWSIFDYAVIVANAGDTDATVTIEKNGQSISDTVPPNGLKKFYLPWIPALKGPDTNNCGAATPMTASVRATGGAYHLTSTVPVTVYQFNALEYKPAGGPAGKNWGACPGNQICLQYGQPVGCFSYSNDASILLPTPVLTGNYRITAQKGWSTAHIGAYFAITGTQDGTNVTIKVSGGGQILGGGGVTPTNGGGQTTFQINRSEVVEVVGEPNSDLSGSLVQADKPIQVISGMPCVQAPDGTQACDHIEETVFPAETLGQHYFVVPPTGPRGNAPGHLVRIYGNVDGTQLTYPSGQPNGAPATINAGQVVDLNTVKQPFEIKGDHEFAVGSFMLGGALLDPNAPVGQQEGDPSQSVATAVEQYRSKYVFLAPDDYDLSYVDIVLPDGANVTLDGSGIPAPTPLGSGYSLSRAKLGGGAQGAHLLVSDKPVGIQVMGYGAYTSYQYPGGSNLQDIAPPPPPIN